MIILENLTKEYDKNSIFVNLNFVFGTGIYQILGRNGVGKSVLLRLIAQIEPATKGSVKNSLKKLPTLYLTDTGIGLPFLNIKDNTKLAAKLLGIRLNDAKYPTLFNSNEKIMHQAYQLSSLGNQLKVGLSLLFTPDKYGLIILDEALSGIDIESREVIAERLKILAKDTVIIIVSHNTLSIESSVQKITINRMEGANHATR